MQEVSQEVQEGDRKMERMLTAMDEITSTSNEIGQIVKILRISPSRPIFSP